MFYPVNNSNRAIAVSVNSMTGIRHGRLVSGNEFRKSKYKIFLINEAKCSS